MNDKTGERERPLLRSDSALFAGGMPVLRVRTKDGTERLTVPAGATLGDVRAQIENELKVPRTQATLARSDQAGPVAKKGAPFSPSDDLLPLSALGVANGDMVFLDYTMERENQAHYVEKDPFKTLVSEGELRQQGKDKWTLTDFMLYRSSKEFVLGAPPEPHAKFVQTDQRATQAFINYMIATGFMQKRIGYLYGRWVTDAVTGDEGVQVHTIYEPAQECTSEDVQLLPDAEGDAKLAQVAAMLGLVQVGVIIGHPAREYAFTINEIMLASQLHAAALAADPVHGKRFVTMKARPPACMCSPRRPLLPSMQVLTTAPSPPHEGAPRAPIGDRDRWSGHGGGVPDDGPMRGARWQGGVLAGARHG